MTNIEIYSKGYCPFCKRTKATLSNLGLEFTEYDITDNDTLRAEMIERSNRKTVPQVFIEGHHIGGSDDFHQALSNDLLAQFRNRKTSEHAL
ncbi:glutaredoxin 3 [Pseudoalteromonas sp. APC 3358]|uniref:Glutaredoxin n=1 Tax=Brumicola blandensis TaxID=3075611 RepID=A0AAW8QY73_9ALTE|nr:MULTISPECIES: glutaredoxin 3 [Alteromonadales]MDN3385167.1 glutaredoxin 3 [Pseudoalteromonas sp. APC 3358]MDT0581540.1 glutaredoxin 3 [Alteromonas sp. W409]